MATKCAVLGNPVKHSLSPVLHNAAYRALGMDWSYEAIEIEPGRFASSVQELFDSGYKGFNITMPCKSDAYEFAEHLQGAAKRLGSVNTLVKDDSGIIHGYSTDGEGFTLSLSELNISLPGLNVLVIGAGGASRAICDALVERGANVLVCSRKGEQSQEIVELVQHPAGGTIEAIEFTAREDMVKHVDLVVNATPIGMTRDGMESTDMPLDPSTLHADQAVVDTIYHPLETEFLKQSREQGCRVLNGLEMLLHQAAISFSLMTQREVPLAEMRDALEAELDVTT